MAVSQGGRWRQINYIITYYIHFMLVYPTYYPFPDDSSSKLVLMMNLEVLLWFCISCNNGRKQNFLVVFTEPRTFTEKGHLVQMNTFRVDGRVLVSVKPVLSGSGDPQERSNTTWEQWRVLSFDLDFTKYIQEASLASVQYKKNWPATNQWRSSAISI